MSIKHDFKFHFRTTKDKDGNEIKAREAVELNDWNVPTAENILSDGSEAAKKLLQDSIIDTLASYGAALLKNAAEVTTANAAEFFAGKLDFEVIANLPPAKRGGRASEKPTNLEAFFADYSAVMPAFTGKTNEQVARAVNMMAENLYNMGRKYKGSIVKFVQTLEVLDEQLGLYLHASEKAEEFANCVEYYQRKIAAALSTGTEEEEEDAL